MEALEGETRSFSVSGNQFVNILLHHLSSNVSTSPKNWPSPNQVLLEHDCKGKFQKKNITKPLRRPTLPKQ